MNRHVDARSAVENESLESASSWPSMTNCADSDNGTSEPSTTESESEDSDTGRDIGAAIEQVVDECRSEHAELAQRALSAVPSDRLRREAVREIRDGDGGYKSRAVVGVLKAFLRWLAEQEDMQIVFTDPEGEEVTAPLENAYSESYIAEKYAVIKDGERGAVHETETLHTAMLSLSGSNLNSREDPRCPGDHLRDLKESFGRCVRRELQRVMTDAGFARYDPEDTPAKWWEYAVVVEPHKSGYPHLHIAVFASAEIEAEMFESVLSKHVEKCEMAGSEAHQIRPEDPDESAVSVNTVDPSKEYDPDGEVEDITNLGSYLAEYIGATGKELWDRPVSELICFSLLWATETQRVHFSNGFHDLAGVGAEIRGVEPDGDGTGWSLAGIRDGDDGDLHDVHVGRVCDSCGLRETGLETGVCPDCGAEALRSTASDYMVEIRGMPGGDPPAARS